ncbi:MAG: hypothetical protein HOP37_10530, partial [Cyclobacteriaceae bacterium]|nr:hypothetical protein [Cyclobacteriaceae bacterium]
MIKLSKSAALFLAATTLLMQSCALHSTTTIKSNERFLLGNNPHNSFRVKLKNVSDKEVEIHRAPIAGGRHSGQLVQPGESVRVRVEANTALVIINNSENEASVQLT